MSIDDGFKKLLEGVKLADEGRDEIMRGLEEAWAGRTDLDHTIATLQAMILEQGRELTATRQEVRELREQLDK